MSTDANAPQKWFSIKEAAEYLDIGEPTIYRWMREGKITYRKVGDSTRFWKQDLDAVMEVHPSDKDIDKVQVYCPACHHDDLIEGSVQATGRTYFVPKKTKFWTLKDSNITTRARMCARCGAIVWFGDTVKLNALREEMKSPSKPVTEERPASEGSE